MEQDLNTNDATGLRSGHDATGLRSGHDATGLRSGHLRSGHDSLHSDLQGASELHGFPADDAEDDTVHSYKTNRRRILLTVLGASAAILFLIPLIWIGLNSSHGGDEASATTPLTPPAPIVNPYVTASDLFRPQRFTLNDTLFELDMPRQRWAAHSSSYSILVDVGAQTWTTIQYMEGLGVECRTTHWNGSTAGVPRFWQNAHVERQMVERNSGHVVEELLLLDGTHRIIRSLTTHQWLMLDGHRILDHQFDPTFAADKQWEATLAACNKPAQYMKPTFAKIALELALELQGVNHDIARPLVEWIGRTTSHFIVRPTASNTTIVTWPWPRAPQWWTLYPCWLVQRQTAWPESIRASLPCLMTVDSARETVFYLDKHWWPASTTMDRLRTPDGQVQIEPFSFRVALPGTA